MYALRNLESPTMYWAGLVGSSDGHGVNHLWSMKAALFSSEHDAACVAAVVRRDGLDKVEIVKVHLTYAIDGATHPIAGLPDKASVSLDVHNREAIAKRRAARHEANVTCPHCGADMMLPDEGNVLASNPPKVRVLCPKCGFDAYKVV